jgi:two-component system CheB/CheR fusion protein
LLSGSEELQSLNEELETSKRRTAKHQWRTNGGQPWNDWSEWTNSGRKNFAESIVAFIEPLVVLDKTCA